jgi:RimJ/RimL family protein N-acetyltransferase
MAYQTMYLDVAAFNVRALRLYERLHFEHLAPFWRRILDFTLNEVPVFTDGRYASMRRFFRGDDSHLECLYYDMALTRERYMETRAPAQSYSPTTRQETLGA